MNRAVFLDRDGVINRLLPGNEAFGLIYRKDDIVILPGVVEFLKELKQRGFILIVVTNQPAVSRGLVSCEQVEQVHQMINQKLGDLIDEFYFCPHHPEMHPDVPEHARKFRKLCDCRKPSNGMLLQAKEKYDLDLSQSWLIGDMVSDIYAGKSSNCRTILLKSASNDRIIVSGIPWDKTVKPDHIIESLSEALKIIN